MGTIGIEALCEDSILVVHVSVSARLAQDPETFGLGLPARRGILTRKRARGLKREVNSFLVATTAGVGLQPLFCICRLLRKNSFNRHPAVGGAKKLLPVKF
jgi:hypothetical protein